MPDDTLSKWGDRAKQHVRLTDGHVSLVIDGDEVRVGPFADDTARKATWADVHWIVARLLETGAETVSRNYERTKDLLLAGERLAALCRAAIACDGYVARTTSMALCLAFYDDAKRRARAPSAYDRIRDPKALEGDPPEEPEAPKLERNQPSLPEPETEALYQVLFHWRERLRIVDGELKRMVDAYMATNPNPQEPCPDDLAMAYKRVFKAKNVVHYLEGAIQEQVGEHVSQPMKDGSGDFPTEMRFLITTAFLTPRDGSATANDPVPNQDPPPSP